MKQKTNKTKSIGPAEALVNRIMADGGFCFARENGIIVPVIVNKVSSRDMLTSIAAFICMQASCPEHIEGAKKIANELFKYGKKHKVYPAKASKREGSAAPAAKATKPTSKAKKKDNV